MSTTATQVRRRSPAWLAAVAVPLALTSAAAGFGWARLVDSDRMALGAPRIRGNDRLGDDEIASYAGLVDRESWLRVSPKRIEERLESHPWIKHAEVRRAWPPALVIDVVERRPVAWVLDEQPWAVDADAQPLAAWNVDDDFDLPVITGIDSGTGQPGDAEWTRHQLEEAVAMLDQIASLEDPPAIDELHLGPEARWSILTASGREIVLGRRDQATAAWQRYRRLMPQIGRESERDVLRVDVSDAADAYVMVGAPATRATARWQRG